MLDYFLTSPNVPHITVGVEMEPADKLSDHGATWIEFSQTEKKQGRGFFLSDPNFLESTNSVIRESILEFSADEFLTSEVDDSVLNSCEITISPILLLELILAKVGGNTILFSAHRKREHLSVVSELSD